MLRTYILAATAAIAISSPAFARDGLPYIGVEAGIPFKGDTKFDFRVTDGTDVYEANDAVKLRFEGGRDFDAVAGYDFGMFRGEAELGYKRATFSEVDFSDEIEEGFDELGIEEPDVGGRVKVLSLMGNALVDVLNREGSSVFLGGGLGVARVKLGGEKDNAMAWQLLAGMRAPLSGAIDVGVKYRYFQTMNTRFSDEDEDLEFRADGKFRSHSVLVGLFFNLGAPVAPAVAVEPAPVPAPVAPATITCPDGSVIAATDACPPPPAPAPAPAPSGERG